MELSDEKNKTIKVDEDQELSSGSSETLRAAEAPDGVDRVPSLREQARAAFGEHQQRTVEEDARKAEEMFARARHVLLKKLKEILGVEDAPITGDTRYVAAAEIDGLTFVQDTCQGWHTLYLLGQCPDCLTEQRASICSLSKLGEMIANFAPDYHGCNCPPKPKISEPLPTPETELINALRNFIRSEGCSPE